MHMPDVVEVYAEDEVRDDQGRITTAASLLVTTAALVAPMSASARQREYGQERQATHEAWFPASAPLTLQSAVVVRLARSDPSVSGQRFAVKTLMNAAGRFWKASLVPSPLT
jgi:hypothetical protein